ncbi:MAG: dihydroorotase [Ilumatobacteraceae bacterium]|jgi:dihydroorotase|nr:dihydroorotase [Actinomycetota bacterium]MDP4635709.1 dihydroorotase [Ilumatobacteraceae bacterium]HBZ61565.1 dihydroorotase [Acidimicrobium sp.]MDP4695121.1 dihydroorotase [Ilumatobacteraceae bacterium]MDP4735153.1 dihydroorotase [Ilumatobacteraceae bacterium]
MSKSVVIKGGTVINRNSQEVADVKIENDCVTEVGKNLKGDIHLDASGCIVSSGFVDLHAHLREPGKEEAETIETGSRAGALGGYTALVAMPNTDPPQDSVAVIDFVREQGKRAGLVDVVPSGCITLGRQGESLAPMAELANAGVTLFTDDGNGVQDAALMRRALEYAKGLGITLAQHCEVAELTKGAVMNECSCCTDLGLPGWPAIAEELMVFRDIELVRITGASMHFLHLSTMRSVDLVRAAKRDGLAITAEVTPHHLSLTQELLASYNPVFKVNPPLRSIEDIRALKAGLLDGTIDAIATDHAPHPRRDKEMSLDMAPPGMLGLETALGVVLAEGGCEIRDVIALMSWNPAKIARIDAEHGRDVVAGIKANLCVFDPQLTWSVDPERLASKSINTPYVGRTLRGRVRHTIFKGTATVIDGQAQK